MKKPWKHRLKTGLLYLLVILLAVFAAVSIWAIRTQGEERTMGREWQISEEFDLLNAAVGKGLAEFRLEGRFPRHASPGSSKQIHQKNRRPALGGGFLRVGQTLC